MSEDKLLSTQATIMGSNNLQRPLLCQLSRASNIKKWTKKDLCFLRANEKPSNSCDILEIYKYYKYLDV